MKGPSTNALHAPTTKNRTPDGTPRRQGRQTKHRESTETRLRERAQLAVRPCAYASVSRESERSHSVPGRSSKDEEDSCHQSRIDMKPQNYALPCPLPSSRLIPGAIRLVQMRDVGNERVVGVGIRQHRADRKEDCMIEFVKRSTTAPMSSCKAHERK